MSWSTKYRGGRSVASVSEYCEQLLRPEWMDEGKYKFVKQGILFANTSLFARWVDFNTQKFRLICQSASRILGMANIRLKHKNHTQNILEIRITQKKFRLDLKQEKWDIGYFAKLFVILRSFKSWYHKMQIIYSYAPTSSYEDNESINSTKR